MTSDGDDDQGDILPPTKKYKQGRLAFSVASVDGATIAEDGEACDNSTITSIHGRAHVEPEWHLTAPESDCCVRGLTPLQPTDTATLEKLREKQDRYRYFSSSWYSTFPWLTV